MSIQIRGLGIALVVSCLVGATVAGVPAQAAQPPLQELAKRPTPKMPEGVPDLNGIWFSYTGSAPVYFDVTKSADGSILAAQTGDSIKIIATSFQKTPNPPKYKPEFQAKLKQIQSQNMNRLDNVFLCGQPGLPRVGAPQQIMQHGKLILFLYSDLNGQVFRTIPLDGRPHRDTNPSFYGVSVGHWEGDTLVVDSRNFSTTTWIGEDGFFHSEQMRVIERLRRIGDTIEYNVTVEDPGVLEQPWIKPMKVMWKTDVELEEPFPCDYSNLDGLDDPRHDQRVK